MAAVRYNVRQEGAIIKKGVCVTVGIQMNGVKDVLDMWEGINESAKY